MMRSLLILFASLICLGTASAEQPNYPRDLFNTGQPVSGTTPFPDYDPYRLNELYRKRHEIELQMFDVINEAALRHDPKLKRSIDLYGKSLGYIPLLRSHIKSGHLVTVRSWIGFWLKAKRQGLAEIA